MATFDPFNISGLVGPNGRYVSPGPSLAQVGGRRGSPSTAARKYPTPKKKVTKAAPQISLKALERNPKYGGTPSKKTSTTTKKKSSGTRSTSSSGGGGGTPAVPAAPPPPNPLDVLQNQLGGQLETLFSGLGTTQKGIQEDYDARSAALLSQLEGYYAGADASLRGSQAATQQKMDALTNRLGLAGVTNTPDDFERLAMDARLQELNRTNQAASNANFDLIRNNYRDFLGDKVSQANASGVMAQVQLMDAINQMRAQQAAAAASGGGGGGGGGGRRRGGGGGSSGGGVSTSAAADIISPPPTPPGPISGVRNLEPPANWQGGRYGSPSIAVKRYPGVSNPSRAGFPRPAGYTPPKPKGKVTYAKPAPTKKATTAGGRKGSPSISAKSRANIKRLSSGRR